MFSIQKLFYFSFESANFIGFPKTISLRRSITIFLLSVISTFFYPQVDSAKIFNKRKIILAGSTFAVYSGSMIMLNELWYKQYKSNAFHFFNDNSEWLQMDKCGHAYTTYQAGLSGIETMRWAGFSDAKSIWFGGFAGSFYMTTIEILDGFSEHWGFSWGDMSANLSGSLLVCLQEQFWKEQRIKLKFSFYPSPYAKYRPNVLGSNFGEQIIKDYNGQVYWVSCNISSFLKKKNGFPKWLNVAFGYGADGMTGGKQNIVYIDENGFTSDFQRQRQFYFSLDADLTRIKTKSKFLNRMFRLINIIKIPFPALEITSGKTNVLIK